MKDKYLQLAKKIILENIDRNEITVFLFGSRAGDDFTKYSDIDVGFISGKTLNRSLVRKISEKIDESRIPYRIDLIDFTKVDREFKKYAMKRIVLWNRGKYLI